MVKYSKLYGFLKLSLGGLFNWYFKVRVEGDSNVPPKGQGAVIATNHQNFYDDLVIPASFKRQVRFLAKNEFFVKKSFKHIGHNLIRAILIGIGTIPLDRTGGAGAADALATAAQRLREGELISIHPEGTRSWDGRIYKGHTGVARMALAAQVPVLPVGLVGLWVDKNNGQKSSDRRQFTVRIGKPMTFEEFYGAEPTAEVLREVTDRVMSAIAELSGQEPAEGYSKEAKSAAKARGLKVDE